MPKLIQIKRKIMLIGNPCVGKTSLVRRYVLDSFSDKYLSTVGFKVSNKKLQMGQDKDGNDIQLNLMIWDLMGSQECNLTPPLAYESSKGAIIVCDLTRKETLDNLPILTKSLYNIVENIPIIYLGNKNDLIGENQFGDKELGEISSNFNAPYLKTSAKTGQNVELAFRTLGSLILSKQKA